MNAGRIKKEKEKKLSQCHVQTEALQILQMSEYSTSDHHAHVE